MKTALKRLQRRVRERWHLVQARRAIARCSRSVARRQRLAARPLPQGPFFAPGVIEVHQRRPSGKRPYLVTLAIAAIAGAILVARGGLFA